MKMFIIKNIQFVLLSFLLIIFINYNVDTYGVLKGNMKSQITEPNKRLLKVEFIIKHQTYFDSFLFGSSRVGNIDTRKIRDDNKWYNMTYSEGLPSEHLDDIKLFIKKGVEIKNIIIGLDEVSYLVSPELHTTQLGRKPYINEFSPFYEYLFVRPRYTTIISKIKGRNLNGFYSLYDIKNSGVSGVKNKDDYIDSHSIQHINDIKFSRTSWQNYYSNRAKQTLLEISEIVNLCEKNNIKVAFFINPIHITTYLRQDMNDFFEFLKGLSKITKFYDFSGINKITSNNLNYYETSHYRPFIGDKISEIIFYKKKIEFQGFGKIVNKDNIDS